MVSARNFGVMVLLGRPTLLRNRIWHSASLRSPCPSKSHVNAMSGLCCSKALALGQRQREQRNPEHQNTQLLVVHCAPLLHGTCAMPGSNNMLLRPLWSPA